MFVTFKFPHKSAGIFVFMLKSLNMNDKILIYTDGSSRGNPGPGGWGAIILKGHNVEELAGSHEKTTNNRMELSAVINALKKTNTENQIRVYTDSEYLINGITKWVFGWNTKGWKTASGGDVLNKDLWQELMKLAGDREIDWRKVKGHAGHPANERVDDLATMMADSIDNTEIKINLFKGSIKDYPVDLTQPTQEQIAPTAEMRKSAKAYSYVSLVDGKVETHSSWADCKDRVDGQSNARFRKAISKEEQDEIIKSWGF
jgi:ribonuclease HI